MLSETKYRRGNHDQESAQKLFIIFDANNEMRYCEGLIILFRDNEAAALALWSKKSPKLNFWTFIRGGAGDCVGSSEHLINQD
jgi:hypothetical protein